MSLVEFLRVQYIDLSEMVHNLKAVAIWQENTSKHCINDYCVSHFLTFLSAKVFPEWKLNPGFGTQKKCFFPLNKSIPSVEVTNTKILWTFFRDQILSPLNGAVPWIEVSQRRGSTVLSIWKRKLTVSSGIKYFLRRPFVQLWFDFRKPSHFGWSLSGGSTAQGALATTTATATRTPKKEIGLLRKATTLHVQFFAITARLRRENAWFYPLWRT